MSFLEDESLSSPTGAHSRLESYVFSCELSSEVPFYTFQGDEEEDLEHFLELRTICLGEGAKEENNVVEVTAMNHRGKKISVPVANLHISCLPMVSLGEFELMAPVTLRLKSGSGPVTVSGLHLVGSGFVYTQTYSPEFYCMEKIYGVASDSEEPASDEDDEEDEEDMPPIKPAKKKQTL